MTSSIPTGEQEEVEEEGEVQVISLDGVHDDDHGIEIVDSSDSEDEEEEEEEMSAASIEVGENTREREREREREKTHKRVSLLYPLLPQ